VRSKNDFPTGVHPNPPPTTASNHFYRSLDRLQRSLAEHCGGGSKVGAIPKLDSQGAPGEGLGAGRVLNKPCCSQKQPPPPSPEGYIARCCGRITTIYASLGILKINKWTK